MGPRPLRAAACGLALVALLATGNQDAGDLRAMTAGDRAALVAFVESL